MFTQCPECGTVFRVTASVLRAAQGQVRCGVCDANFDALRFLTDAVDGEVPEPAAGPAAEPAPLSRPPPPPPPAPRAAPPLPLAPTPAAPRHNTPATRTTPSVDEDRALAEIAAALAHDAELSRQRAAMQARLETPPPVPTPVPAPLLEDDDVNVLEPTDVENIVLGGESAAGEDSADAALEFNVPPGQWDRVFVAEDGTDTITPLDINLGDLEDLPQTDARAAEQLLSLIDEPIPAPAAARVAPAGPAAAAGDLELAEEEPLSRTDEYAMLELELAGIREGLAQTPAAANAAPEPAAELEASAEDGAMNIEDAWFDPGHGNVPAEPEVAEPVATRRQPIEQAPFAPPPDETGLVVEELSAPPRRWRAASAAGAVALTLLLLVQLLHHNRDALGAMDGIGAPIAALYARLGMPLEPHWDLGAYDVKQWGAATDNAPGSLRLRASLVNRARRAQPYPLLRVTLEDRFGAKVARREFTPQEYLPGRTAPAQLLAPGARADADLSLADPGAEAVGFELDVCLKRAGTLNCGIEPKSAAGGG